MSQNDSNDQHEEEPDFEALAGVAASLRQLISHVRKTKAPKELLAEVEGQARALAAKLAPFDHPGPYAQRRLILSEEIGMDLDTEDPVEYFPYSPIIGPLNPIAPPVPFKLVERELHATHSFDAQYNGPPASVHGGVIALVFDELLGSLGAILGIGGFTGTLKVIYRSLTPLDQPIRMRSWVDREEGVKIFIKGQMFTTDSGGDERLCSEAEGIFIRPKVSILKDAMAKSRGKLAGS
jgi:hypothetical protein